MFFIYGWNHQVTKHLGSVEQHQCNNCHNTEVWQLNKISRYFTLFFIPIFPHNTDYWYHCPICNFGVKLDFLGKARILPIAKINSDFLNNLISEEERIQKLNEYYENLRIETEKKDQENLLESVKWEKLASEKSTSELQTILNEKRGEYNQAFIIAAEKEISKRID
jgi:hypothetical protein